jgi:hypothetical protein
VGMILGLAVAARMRRLRARRAERIRARIERARHLPLPRPGPHADPAITAIAEDLARALETADRAAADRAGRTRPGRGGGRTGSFTTPPSRR